MTHDLAPVDRWTLHSWRALNVLGWGGLAFVVAELIHRAAQAFSVRYYANITLNWRPDFSETLGFVTPKMAFRFGISLLIGLAIGGIVGAKVWRWRPGVAALVAGVYFLITILFVEFSSSLAAAATATDGISFAEPSRSVSGAAAYIYDAIGALTIPIAALWARWIGRRRVTA